MLWQRGNYYSVIPLHWPGVLLVIILSQSYTMAVACILYILYMKVIWNGVFAYFTRFGRGE